MYLTADKVVNGMLCAQQVLRDERVWAENADFLPISIDATKEVVAAISGYTVEMRSVSFTASHVFARVEKYSSMIAEIDVRHSLSGPWKRFVSAKELMHLIIDKDEDMSPYGDETLDKLVRDGHIGVISQNGDKPPAQSELIAEVAALELLYPIQARREDKQRMDAQELTLKQIALKYDIPPNFAETAFDDGYLAVLMKAFEDFQTENNA